MSFEKLCPDCLSLGTKQILGDDMICPVHGFVSPVRGEMEKHQPDQKKQASLPDVKNKDKKKKKDDDNIKDDNDDDKVFESEEVKMLTDPEIPVNGVNISINNTWSDLAGDD